MFDKKLENLKLNNNNYGTVKSDHYKVTVQSGNATVVEMNRNMQINYDMEACPI